MFKRGSTAADLLCHVVQGTVFFSNDDRLRVNINGINLQRPQLAAAMARMPEPVPRSRIFMVCILEGVGTSRQLRHSRQSRSGFVAAGAEGHAGVKYDNDVLRPDGLFPMKG